MKIGYWIAATTVIVIVIITINILDNEFKSPGEKYDKILTATAIGVALISSIIALGLSNPKKNILKFSCSVRLNKIKGMSSRVLAEFDDDVQKLFANYPEEIETHKVIFSIKNNSNYVLNNPAITLRLPHSFRFPSLKEMQPIFRSDLFSGQEKNVYHTEWGRTTVLSNVKLPYLNPSENIEFWVRMCLDEINGKEKKITISLNPSNVDGMSKQLKISGSQLLGGNTYYFKDLT